MVKYTCSGRRNTMFPRTMTLPDKSSILAYSAPWSSFSQFSTQIRTNSLSEIELCGISLSFSFSFSTWESLRIFLASSTDNLRKFSETAGSGAGGLRSSRRMRPPGMLMPLSLSRRFSPNCKEKKSGSLVADSSRAFRWRNLLKKPLSEESDDVRYSLWKLVLAAFGGTTRARGEGEDNGDCCSVKEGDVTLLLSKRRLTNILRSPIDYCEEDGRRESENEGVAVSNDLGRWCSVFGIYIGSNFVSGTTQIDKNLSTFLSLFAPLNKIN